MKVASEKAFEKQVKQFLKDKGCWVLKTWSNGIQRKGIPDLLVCCNGFFLAVELKAEDCHPSDLQLWNIDQIRKAHGFALVLYPDQFGQFRYLVDDLLYDRNGLAYERIAHFNAQGDQ